MSDLTDAILRDRTKYPDDRKIVLADGEEITVKELRDSLLPKADFTRASEGWSRKERELTSSVEGLQAQLAEALKTKAPAEVARTPAGGYSEEDLLGDPILGPIVRDLKATRTRLTEHEERMKGHEEYVMTREYKGQLASIASQHNARYNPDGTGKAFDQKAFLDYVVEKQTPNLDTAYSAWSRDDEIERVTRDAEARGEERGMKKAAVPNVPFGRRRAPLRDKDLPESLDKVTDEMLETDPDMQDALRADGL
jgi:hypothetical protein